MSRVQACVDSGVMNTPAKTTALFRTARIDESQENKLRNQISGLVGYGAFSYIIAQIHLSMMEEADEYLRDVWWIVERPQVRGVRLRDRNAHVLYSLASLAAGT